jgi:hypothetical protein
MSGPARNRTLVLLSEYRHCTNLRGSGERGKTMSVYRISGSHSDGHEESCLWYTTPCNSVKVNRRFGRTCHFRLQGRRISQAGNQHEAGSMHSRRQSRHVRLKRRLIFNGLHGVTSQKIGLSSQYRMNCDVTALPEVGKPCICVP